MRNIESKSLYDLAQLIAEMDTEKHNRSAKKCLNE